MFFNRFTVPAFVLTACLAACGPNAMPKGYVYHDEVYKSPNPPQSSKFTEMQRKSMGPEQAEQFRMAVYQLVENLTARAGIPPKPVYVMQPKPLTPFYANFDNDLRESLRHVGYRLADSPVDAYIVTYNAESINRKDRKAGDMSPNVRLSIHVRDGAGEESKLLTHETGDFYIAGAEHVKLRAASFSGVETPETLNPSTNK